MPTVPHGGAITVEHLLRHTSGLFNYTDSQAFMAKATNNRADLDPAGIRQAFATVENHLFAPGSSWAYSNTNYIVLGMIIEAVTQHSLAQALHRGIFDPLKMTHIFLDGEGFRPGSSRARVCPIPKTPHNLIDLTHVMHVSAAWAAGGVVSTADDVLAFDQALFGGRLVQPDTFARMKAFVDA